MADNVPISAGTGTTIATDDVAGVHYQRVKLVDGTLEGVTAIAGGGGVESGALRVTVASDSTGLLAVKMSPATSGGLTTFHLISAATTNATVVKGSAGQLFGWFIYNANASMRKVAFHNSSTAPTAGVGIYFTLTIPGGAAANVEMVNGIAFSTGIAITTVTGIGDADNVAVAVADLNINLWYK